jgi:hypothetical protein
MMNGHGLFGFEDLSNRSFTIATGSGVIFFFHSIDHFYSKKVFLKVLKEKGGVSNLKVF